MARHRRTMHSALYRLTFLFICPSLCLSHAGIVLQVYHCYQLSPTAPARRCLHAKSTIALYTSSAINNRRSVVHCRPHLPRLTRRRQVLSTPDRPLSLFISHSLTVDVPWRNFHVHTVRQSFREKYPYF